MINLDSKKVTWIDIVSHFSQLFLFHSIKRVITTSTKKITQIMPILLRGTLRPHRELGSKDMAEIRPTTKSLME